MSVRFIQCLYYRCQLGLHVWVWSGNCLDKRLKCETCGVPQ